MKEIIVIHRSEIIREGIAALLRQNHLFNFQLFEDLSDASSRISDSVLILVDEDEALAFSPEDASELNYIIISSKKDGTPESNAFNIYDASQELSDKIKAFQNQSSINGKRENSLTERETEVLKLLSFGHSNKDIADKLFISIHTVISHRKNITEKLGIKSVSGLTVYAIINNLIDTEGLNLDDLI